MNTEPTINTDEFLKILSLELNSLPTRDLELCDLSNEIGLILSKLAGADKSLENEFKSGIEHGFDLVRRDVKKVRSTRSWLIWLAQVCPITCFFHRAHMVSQKFCDTKTSAP